MSISTPPPPAPPKKSGMGCLGCGCVILVVLFLLFGALVGGLAYLSYKAVYTFTSDTPANIPAATVDDQAYQTTKQKLAGFAHDVTNHQAATVSLSGDEINALIANNPDLTGKNIHAFVTLTNDEARLQLSIPVSALLTGAMSDRYIDLDTTFKLHFDTDTKHINADFETVKLENNTLIGDAAGQEQQAFSTSFVRSFNQSLNQALRKNSVVSSFLDQTKSIEIQNGQLVIQTQ